MISNTGFEQRCCLLAMGCWSLVAAREVCQPLKGGAACTKECKGLGLVAPAGVS